jgi:uncharacterized membrane protein YkvA (DUF1232 family)
MPDLLGSIVTAIVVIALAWLVLVVVMWVHRPTRDKALALIKSTPDIAHLAFRVARDGRTPTRYRVGLALLGVYLLSPIDIVPDFLPGIGALDDVILAALLLRWVGRGVGRDRLEQLWPGDEDGLSILRGLLGDYPSGG